jgi:hypothetical protein
MQRGMPLWGGGRSCWVRVRVRGVRLIVLAAVVG